MGSKVRLRVIGLGVGIGLGLEFRLGLNQRQGIVHVITLYNLVLFLHQICHNLRTEV